MIYIFSQSLTTNSTRKLEKDLSEYDAWQQLKIFQQQHSRERDINKDSSDDRSSLNMQMQPTDEGEDGQEESGSQTEADKHDTGFYDLHNY